MNIFLRTVSLAMAFALVAACGDSGPTLPDYNQTGNPPGNRPDTTTVTPVDTTTQPNTGPQASGFVDKTLVDGGVTYKYKVFVPSNYNTVSKVPVLLALHSSGEKGFDNLVQTQVGVGRVIRASPSTFPALVVFPQGPSGEGSTKAAFVRVSQIALNQTLNEYGKRDLTRVYLTGHSYGAINGYEIAYLNPTRFAAFLPISGYVCGGCIFGGTTTNTQAMVTVAPLIKTLPIWQFQGEIDTQVLATTVRQEVLDLKALGSPIIYTEIKGGDHAIWDGIYARSDVWTWLWAQHR